MKYDRIMYTALRFAFFFSSRRRHTRSDRDWSSDVCSSDLMDTATRATVRVRFFARYAELVGRSEAAVSLPLPATVGDVVRRVREDFSGARALPARPLAAVNLKQVKLETPVHDGDEVALLPPIAGG